MSTFAAISDASETLRVFLQQEMNAAFGAPGPPPQVVLMTPREMDLNEGVSVWLYRVVRDEFLTNQPPVRISPDQERPTPLPVLLHYLVTPLMNDDSATEQLVLGKVLQALYDHPILRSADLQGALDQRSVELRVTLETLSLEEITRVWYALGSEIGYQLCVSYVVQVIEIDSARPPDAVVPVSELDTRYNVIVETT